MFPLGPADCTLDIRRCTHRCSTRPTRRIRTGIRRPNRSSFPARSCIAILRRRPIARPSHTLGERYRYIALSPECTRHCTRRCPCTRWGSAYPRATGPCCCRSRRFDSRRSGAAEGRTRQCRHSPSTRTGKPSPTTSGRCRRTAATSWRSRSGLSRACIHPHRRPGRCTRNHNESEDSRSPGQSTTRVCCWHRSDDHPACKSLHTIRRHIGSCTWHPKPNGHSRRKSER